MFPNVNIPARDVRTGLIFDDRMTAHDCTWDSNHPEKPERYLSSMKKIKDYDLLQRCRVIPSRKANIEDLKLVHSEEYIDKIKKSADIEDVTEFEEFASKYDSIYLNSQSYDCALLAAGCTLELVSAVLQGSVSNGLAIVRPPGHHATVKDACGYCFFNNVAIATKHALENYNLKRILIVDWDVHHGQATQRMFYNDPRVLYFSIHRYENGEFWPNLRESNFDFVGSQAAQGFNINVPLNSTEQGNAEYLAIFNNVLLPIAYEFAPELVLVSAGYDAAIGCPEGEMRITPPAYAHFLNSLSCLAGGRICVILEGGYCLSSLSESVAFTLKSLLGDPCPAISPCVGIHESSVESILNVISVHRLFWDAIKLQNVYDSNFDDDGSNKHIVKIKYTGQPLEGSAVFPTRDYYPIQPPNVIAALEAEIKELINEIDFSSPKYRTGFVFDPKIEQSFCSVANHSETADHTIAFYKKLKESRLLSKCVYIQSGKLLSEAELIQDSDYCDKIQLDCALSNELSDEMNKEFSMVKFCQKDNICIGNACEKLLKLIDAVAMKMCINGFALIRPSGHYPDSENASGLCIFNSAAVAAKYLIAKYRMNRILIVDLDVQRGNGIQNFFYEDDKVLYISMYYHDGECFPTSLEAKEKLIGSNKGKGFNINIPFGHTICDGDYITALFHIIMPVAYEFCPEFVLLSLGYDDGMSRTHLSPSCIGVITKLLSGLSYGKVVLISESNLSCENGPDIAAHCLSALLNENCVPLRAMKPTSEGIDTIRNVVKVHKKYWKSLAFDVEVPCSLDTSEMEENSSSTVSSAHLRRQSSNPVAIPKIQDENETCFSVEFERGENLSNNAFFCVTPLEYCPHLELLQPIPNEGLNPRASCQACKDPNENWVCLHCYQVYCGRFVNQHMVQHGIDMKHYLTLSYSDLSVWCYACDAYIHNNLLVPIKEHAHDAKFNSS
ncbi:histone deacetylase 6 [Nephila pilipes]|uniref:Protein deacetylase HDAC6 n=1 Tax=Nephila pilipes TaxID=299642 RepID=A0A8X6PPZ4_NEPPI|nr:histone deacetylase 6 [Nephila pilipes]